MENKEVAYRNLLERLAKREPLLDDACGLTDRIMQKVEQADAGRIKVRVVRIMGVLSGVAASVLICLLAFETLKYPTPSAKNGSICGDVGRDVFTKYKKTETFESIVKRKSELRVRRAKLIEAYIYAVQQCYNLNKK